MNFGNMRLPGSMKSPFVLGYVFKMKPDVVTMCFSPWMQTHGVGEELDFYQIWDLPSVCDIEQELRMEDSYGFLIVEFKIGKEG